MALLLDREDSAREGSHAPSLHAWLNGDWALLFSHPDDFAQYDLEADRWLTLLEHALVAARVRPIALASNVRGGLQGWIAHVNGANVRVQLARAGQQSHVMDFRPHALRESIARAQTRFVMIIDESLRLRRTFAYALGNQLPPLFDLITMALKVRGRSVASGEPRAASHILAPVGPCRRLLAARGS